MDGIILAYYLYYFVLITVQTENTLKIVLITVPQNLSKGVLITVHKNQTMKG